MITGGGSGLGFIIAATLVANGAIGISPLLWKLIETVYITGRRQSALDESIAKLNGIRPNRAVAYSPVPDPRRTFQLIVAFKPTSTRKKV